MVENWFLELNGYALDIKIILVGNKCDMPSGKIQISNEEAKNMAYKFGASYITTSALEDKNISEDFSTLAVEIYHLKIKKEKENDTKQRKKSIKLVNNSKNNDSMNNI